MDILGQSRATGFRWAVSIALDETCRVSQEGDTLGNYGDMRCDLWWWI